MTWPTTTEALRLAELEEATAGLRKQCENFKAALREMAAENRKLRQEVALATAERDQSFNRGIRFEARRNAREQLMQAMRETSSRFKVSGAWLRAEMRKRRRHPAPEEGTPSPEAQANQGYDGPDAYRTLAEVRSVASGMD